MPITYMYFEKFLTLALIKPPEPHPWMSHGSEVEIDEAQVKNTRKQIKLICSRKRKFFAAPTKYDNTEIEGRVPYLCYSFRKCSDRT